MAARRLRAYEDRDGRGPKQPVIPQSETMFTGTGLTYQFVRDDHGNATDLIEGHVAGDFKYARQK